MQKNLRALGLVVGLIAGSLASTLGCREGATLFTQLSDARQLAADLRLQFNIANDASNRAVMADTDEASIKFAQDAEQTSTLVEQDVAQLQKHLQALALAGESQTLEQFAKQFADYRGVDRTILGLAVENTNLKAQALSFGPAREAADRFEAALTLSPGLTPNARSQGEGLVFKAVLAIRELQTLEAPHIASSDEAAMTEMEKKMAVLDGRVAEALAQLSAFIEPSRRTVAETALADYKKVRGQVIALSRRNTNVRSLDLALRVKPPLTAACDDTLSNLQQALAKEGSAATR